jgi:hypothetical protein
MAQVRYLDGRGFQIESSTVEKFARMVRRGLGGGRKIALFAALVVDSGASETLFAGAIGRMCPTQAAPLGALV